MIDDGAPVMDADAEAAAVLAAVGYRPSYAEFRVSPLTHVENVKQDGSILSSILSERALPEDVSTSARVMKSPDSQNLDSPTLSNTSSLGDIDEESRGDAVQSPGSNEISPMSQPVNVEEMVGGGPVSANTAAKEAKKPNPEPEGVGGGLQNGS